MSEIDGHAFGCNPRWHPTPRHVPCMTGTRVGSHGLRFVTHALSAARTHVLRHWCTVGNCILRAPTRNGRAARQGSRQLLAVLLSQKLQGAARATRSVFERCQWSDSTALQSQQRFVCADDRQVINCRVLRAAGEVMPSESNPQSNGVCRPGQARVGRMQGLLSLNSYSAELWGKSGEHS